MLIEMFNYNTSVVVFGWLCKALGIYMLCCVSKKIWFSFSQYKNSETLQPCNILSSTYFSRKKVATGATFKVAQSCIKIFTFQRSSISLLRHPSKTNPFDHHSNIQYTIWLFGKTKSCTYFIWFPNDSPSHLPAKVGFL